eukprot:6052384-Amphidinium_carterae.1
MAARVRRGMWWKRLGSASLRVNPVFTNTRARKSWNRFAASRRPYRAFRSFHTQPSPRPSSGGHSTTIHSSAPTGVCINATLQSPAFKSKPIDKAITISSRIDTNRGVP